MGDKRKAKDGKQKTSAPTKGRNGHTRVTPPEINDIVLAKRRKMAVTLKIQGGTYRQIADRISQIEGMPPKYSEAQAYRDVQAELKRCNEELKEDVAELRSYEKLLLDYCQSKLMGSVKLGDVYAIDRVVRIAESRRRLMGTDRPVKVAPTTPDGENEYRALTNEELDARIVEVLAALDAGA
jgi:hypothetical protein